MAHGCACNAHTHSTQLIIHPVLSGHLNVSMQMVPTNSAHRMVFIVEVSLDKPPPREE